MALPLAWKTALAALLAAFPLGAVAYCFIAGQPASALLVLASAGLSLLSWYLLAAVHRELGCLFQQLQEALTRLERGDFGARMLPLGAGREWLLAKGFNDMARETGRIVSEIRDSAAEVAHAAVELKGGAELVAEAAQQQEKSATETAAAVEEMTVSIAEVASQSRDAEQTSLAVSELTATGGCAIAQSTREIQSLATAVGEVSELMNRLAARSHEVAQSTGMIREISDQTNLLALNAAIEAARAGESGRGFAVVADEVRKLAQRARSAADEITGTVAAIEIEMKEAVAHMEAASGQARDGAAHAEGVSKALVDIDAQAKTALDNVHQIAAGAQQQSATSSAIAQHIELIAQGIQQNSQAATESSGMASHLSQLASGMRGALAGFRG